MSRPIELHIDLAALRHNWQRLSQGKQAMAVVKADAYGHGLAAVLPALQAAPMLALVEWDKACALRQWGWHKPILLLHGPYTAADIQLAQQQAFDLMIHTAEQLAWLESLPRTASQPLLNIHLKLNSGMNRLGFAPTDYRAAYQQLRALPCVNTITHTTHFANADAPQGDASQNAGISLAAQQRCFDAVTAGLPGARSLANSAATIATDFAADCWHRIGIALYGASPAPESKAASTLGLRAVQSLRTRLIAIQSCAAGTKVGYGSRFTCAQATRIGVVACGYADGYPRHAIDGTPILVAGQRCAVAGRVSMDLITVDLSQAPEAQVGSEVELWGEALPIDQVATASDTIAYELMCKVTPRVPRVIHS